MMPSVFGDPMPEGDDSPFQAYTRCDRCNETRKVTVVHPADEFFCRRGHRMYGILESEV